MAHVMPQVHMQLAHYINVNHTMTFYKFMVILFTFKVIVSFYPYVYLTPISPRFVAQSLFITVYSPGYSLNCPVLFKITSPFSVNEMPGRYLHNHPVSCLPGTQPVADVISGLQSLSQPQTSPENFNQPSPQAPSVPVSDRQE